MQPSARACPHSTGWAWPIAALLLAGCAGDLHRAYPDMPVKIGRPYSAAGRTWVPADDPRYDTIGEASWYGGREQGHPTASGERFDKRRVSAAHPTLPLPSYVEVTRLDTGDRMIVRINDRGPYARDRIIDLSREAARQLGIDQAGHALVRVRRVVPTRTQADALRRGYPVMLARVMPSATPPRAARIAPPAPILNGYGPPPVSIERYLLVATPADPDAADALVVAVGAEGGHVVATGNGYRVLTGPYPDETARAAALARLQAHGYQGVTDLNAAPSTSR